MTTLLALALLLPVVVCVLLVVGALLAAMDDSAGSLAMARARLSLLTLWGVDLVVLLLALGMQQAAFPVPPDARARNDDRDTPGES